eukprot:TRINITY_DN4454_c0_g1_i1.p1 TRINITY_DN4454_c0_g1~~TRINITY_DN4454_c0_g1_i1.p1  ORF type:complete len:517 (+),score=59.86 TRINITY_DN4454_c0_g1_i1:39-1589(+)
MPTRLPATGARAMFAQAPAAYGGYGAGGYWPRAVCQKLCTAQGQLRACRERVRTAEAALGREAARRRSAEAALAAERRKNARLLREIAQAAQPAAVAECPVQASTVRSPRARGAAVCLPTSPLASQGSRGTAPPSSPRGRGAALALPASPRALQAVRSGRASPAAREPVMAMPTSPISQESKGAMPPAGFLLARPPSQSRGTMTLEPPSPRALGAALALPPSPRAQQSRATMTSESQSPRARGAALALPASPRSQTSEAPESPKAQGVSDADSSPHQGGAAATPRTPLQSPERSAVELTPAPSSPRLQEDAGGLRSELSGPLEGHTEATTCDELAATGAPPRGSKSKQAEILLEDNVCFWVATFVRRNWACVCIKSARAVYGVITVSIPGWDDFIAHLGWFQSAGVENPFDAAVFGPGAGPIIKARVHMLRLKLTIGAPQCTGDRHVKNWYSRWMIFMDSVMNMYDTMRLRHRELYQSGREIIQSLNINAKMLHDVLEVCDQRLALEEAAADASAG